MNNKLKLHEKYDIYYHVVFKYIYLDIYVYINNDVCQRILLLLYSAYYCNDKKENYNYLEIA